MSSFTRAQVLLWLDHIQLPRNLAQPFIETQTLPKTLESLRAIMRCQIATFPYENLAVHYSPTHLVNIQPDVLYEKMMGTNHRNRGGYCMEVSIFFHHMLRGLGFDVYMTGVRNRTRVNGIPCGEYQGWTHITNIVSLPDGEKYALDVAFGGDGPTIPLPLNDRRLSFENLGTQEVRLIYDCIDKQHPGSGKLWIYQYRNGAHLEWNSFYSFAEIEFFQEDFEVMNWWAVSKTVHRQNVIAVRFLGTGDSVVFAEGTRRFRSDDEILIVGKVMLVNDVVKVNLGGRTTVVRQLKTEGERVAAINDYFGIRLTDEEQRAIRGWDTSLA